ncbi:MAG TPA: TIGR00282 family metallophosphoesterase [Pirellulaceae bacterium]|nr:TIGR00282 family metallophosphoesterase [Pirellulaceae bacterium]
MRVLFIGDIVGRDAVQMVVDAVPYLRRTQSLDLVVANAENADGGSGVTPSIYRKLIAAGVDGLTLGDHIYKKKEIIDLLDDQTAIVKPANYPATAPGRTWMTLKSATGHPVAVVSLIGRVFMKPVDCPFAAIDRVLSEIPPEIKIRIVDFHAEATSDKHLMGRYLDGRVSAVLGTHTHVATADEQIFPGGTAYQSDVGMTGPHDSILGRVVENVLQATVSFVPCSFTVASGDCRINGAVVDIDHRTGKAQRISRFCLNEQQWERWREES